MLIKIIKNVPLMEQLKNIEYQKFKFEGEEDETIIIDGKDIAELIMQFFKNMDFDTEYKLKTTCVIEYEIAHEDFSSNSYAGIYGETHKYREIWYENRKCSVFIDKIVDTGFEIHFYINYELLN